MGQVFGHEVYYDDETGQFYLGDGTVYNEKIHQELICPKCNKKPTKEGHDPCLGELPGVKAACCGHGVDKGYIFFEDGVHIEFDNVSIKKM